MPPLSVSYTRKGGEDVHALAAEGALDAIVIDNTEVDLESRGGVAKQLLASAVLYCYCAALDKALASRGAEYGCINGTAILETGRDEMKRARVTKITLDVTVHMSEDQEDIFERVAKVMRNGCLVSASIEKAITVEYSLGMRSDDAL